MKPFGSGRLAKAMAGCPSFGRDNDYDLSVGVHAACEKKPYSASNLWRGTKPFRQQGTGPARVNRVAAAASDNNWLPLMP